MSTATAIILAMLVLLAMGARWATKSVAHALVFIALLCASPYIVAAGLGLLAVENEQHVRGIRR